MVDELFNNTGEGVLRVPGLPGVPLDYELSYGQRFAHGAHEWCQLPGITTRELAMTSVMNRITDKHDWHRHINDEQYAAELEAEARNQYELLSDKAWEWCLAELRDKARDYERKRFVRVLDTGSCVCKSDELLESKVAVSLKSELDPLFTQHHAIGIISDLVDPYMFPLMFGRTRFLTRGSVKLPGSHAETDDMFSSRAQTTLTRSPINTRRDSDDVDAYLRHDTHLRDQSMLPAMEEPRRYLWSSTYQCLPCDVSFVGADNSVRITSYMNNLHPRHRMVYSDLETVMAAAVKMWNDCLIAGPEDWQECSRAGSQQQRGGFPLRILAEASIPDDVYRTMLDYCDVHRPQAKYRKEAQVLDRILYDNPKKYRENCQDASAQAQSPLLHWPKLENIEPAQDISEKILKVAEDVLGIAMIHKEPDDSLDGIWDDLEDEVEERNQWQMPEPGSSFTYNEWLLGHNPSKARSSLPHTIYQPLQAQRIGPVWRSKPVQLEQTFKTDGLQILVRIGEMRLSPIEVVEEDWRLEGHLNEHIVASAIYAYDVCNVDCIVSFRQDTPAPFNTCNCGLQSPELSGQTIPQRRAAYRRAPVLVPAGMLPPCQSAGDSTNSMQTIGSINMRQNRLIAFPQIVERHLKARTIDTSQAGYMRSITLHLVDPHYRICSTRNVPPQQSDWFEDVVARLLLTKLPVELVNQILDHYIHSTTKAKAETIRKRMLIEQQWFTYVRHAGIA